jgi:UDP-glucose 4-epimerase
VIFDFIKKLRNDPKNLQIFGDGQQSKSYLYIDDVIDAFLLITDKAKSSINLYNLTSKDFITVTEIAEIIINKMGLKTVKIKYTGGKAGWKGDVPVVRLKDKLLQNLGWQRKYSTKKAVEETVQALLTEL